MDELYVLARAVLLDALDALGTHRDAVVLVGAQAIYLRVGEGDLAAVAPFTTDGDLAVEPSRLSEIPPLEQALLAASFTAKDVGIWMTKRATSTKPDVEVSVDLLVPDALDGGKGRGARLPGHDKRAARRVAGLDGAVVDFDVMKLAAFEDADKREHALRVAGPAALLVSKLHKIAERAASPARLKDKDALDVLRLLRGTTTEDVTKRYRGLVADERAALVGGAGLKMLREQFGERAGLGVEMAVRATAGLVDEDEIRASCTLLANDLLDALAGK